MNSLTPGCDIFDSVEGMQDTRLRCWTAADGSATLACVCSFQYLRGSRRSTRTPWHGTGRVSSVVKVPSEAGSTRSRTDTCNPLAVWTLLCLECPESRGVGP